MRNDESGAGDSSPALIIYQNGDAYSAATQAGVAFYNFNLPAAQVWLIENGFDVGLLDSPVDGLTWRSTLTAAFASEIEGINETLADLAPSSDVEAVRSKAETIAANLADLSASVAAEQNRRKEIAELQRALRLMFPTIKAALPGKPSDEEVQQNINATYHARRLREIQ